MYGEKFSLAMAENRDILWFEEAQAVVIRVHYLVYFMIQWMQQTKNCQVSDKLS